MAYGDFKDLTRTKVSDKMLRDKAYNFAKSLKYDKSQRGLASMVYKSFYKKSASLVGKSASGGAVKNENVSSQELAEKLHNQ